MNWLERHSQRIKSLLNETLSKNVGISSLNTVKEKLPKRVNKKLTEQDFEWAAKELNCEIAAIKAVAEVESRGGGFLPDGQAVILFEGHIFWRRLKIHGVNPILHVKGNGSILHSKWTKAYYNMNQHERLQKAVKIHRLAALESASWGMFQIMGFNYSACGFKNVQEFINATMESEGGQLKCFVNFILTNRLDDEIKEHRWADFARRYNGSGYKANKYDIKMAEAYQKYAKIQKGS